ncbi:ABC transporter ATP-binding protein [Corynebacterium pseudopelargi]|uniref:Hemin import ATP-binding protein HmuV n=1 Tax=Corynebacterium pseudopelargi TaxID=2080757 RepID=A0A3G6J1B9_9CORY|nr:ABC transporter ATP-binding protein [Corynebacterium pseudopelargi]AZA10160.1 Hemin import ATP-binding protein HmuV [Corynebacterium pseudopelargi]
MSLQAHEVSWKRGNNLVVNGVSLTPEPNTTVGLLGPNGSGKSSFLRLLHGEVRPTEGRVLLNERDLHSIGRKERAKHIAVVSQHVGTELNMSVREVVALGRIPFRSLIAAEQRADQAAIEAAMERTGVTHLQDRSWHQLSGGEQQRVHIARALAQEPKELLLDEPTNHLDIQHQLEILRLVRSLDATCVVALHDLNLAAMFCDSLMLLKDGKVAVAGATEEVLRPETIQEIFGVRAKINRDPDNGRMHIAYEC